MTPLSIGTATYDGNSKETPADFIHRADVNLYHAKRAGKNCVR